MLGDIDRSLKPIQPKYFIAKPNREIIAKLNEAYNCKRANKLNDIDELDLTIPFYVDINHRLVKNKNIEILRERYLIKVVTGNKVEWFIIKEISENSSDSETSKSIRCFSAAHELTDKVIKSYSVESYHAEQVLTDLLANTIWNIDYLDADFKLTYRAFDFPSTNVLDAIFSVAETYNAIVHFDTDKRTISMTKPELTGLNRGLTFSYGKYLSSMDKTTQTDEMVTRLSATGKDGLGIQKVNPTGQNYIENFGFFMYPFERDSNKNVLSSSYHMSDSLCHALLDYEDLVEAKTGQFETYLDQLEKYETQMNQLEVDLNKLKNNEAVVTDTMLAQQFDGKMFFEKYPHSGSSSRSFSLNSTYAFAVMIKVDNNSGVTVSLDGVSKPTISGQWVMLGKVKNTNSIYVGVNGGNTGVFIQVANISLDEYNNSSNDSEIVERYSLDNKQNQIRLKEIEISNLNDTITNVKNQIKSLQTSLLAENNFTSEQLQELNYFVIEREFNDDKYVDEHDLYDATLEKFKELQQPSLSIDVDIVNFLEIVEEQRNWDKLTLGDFVNIKYEPTDTYVTARISEISYDYEGSSVSLTLSNAKNVNDESTRIEKFLSDSKNTNIIVDTSKNKWGQAVISANNMTVLFQNFWDSVTNQINMANNEFVEISNRGITIYDIHDPNKFVRMTHGAIGMTDNGGLLYKMAITPTHIVAENVWGKLIVGERLTLGDIDGLLEITGPKFMIFDRCGREVQRIGLLSSNPDVFGTYVNRYASAKCNDTTKINVTGLDNSRGFYIDKIKYGTTSNVFGLSQDGNLRLRTGDNNEVMIVTSEGLGLGAENWIDAPFRVNYKGEAWLESLWATNAYIQNSVFENGDLIGNRLTLRDGGNVMKLWPREGFWAGSEALGADDPEKAPMWIKMDGTAIFKKLIVTDGNNKLLMDSENKKIYMNNWDIVGAGAIDAELLAANILTAEDGFISSLIAGKLSTLTNAALLGWSNYIKIEGKELKFLTGTVDGAGTHKALSDGRLLYWLSSEQKGEMTTEVTPWPVMVYKMKDKTKMKLYFEGDGESAYPIIDMGEGDSKKFGKGSIQKPNGAFDFVYTNSNYGRERSLRLKDDGLYLKSEKGEINITMDSFNVLANKSVKIGVESGSYIEIAENGDININSSKNIKINGSRIDLN
ncbi:MAG: phage tail spike protein [Bacillota bacterium]